METATATKKQTHTPGPWTLQDDQTFSTLGDKRIVGADRISPAIVFGGIRETEPNARLIAAAPELLAALRAVTNTDDDCPMCDRGRLRNPKKTHWPECPFGRAQSLIARVESDNVVDGADVQGAGSSQQPLTNGQP